MGVEYMANKDPAFLFYSGDFLVGVSDLTMEERGQYITLIALQHQKGHLSKRAIDLSIPNISDFVLAKFQTDKNGCYYNARVEEEIKKRENYTKSQREKVLKRWGKNTEEYTEVSSEDIPRYIPTENENKNEIKDIDNNLYNLNTDENAIKNIDNNLYNLFLILYDLYPKGKIKNLSLDAFLKSGINESNFEQVKTALENQIHADVFFPLMHMWIKQRRWEKEII